MDNSTHTFKLKAGNLDFQGEVEYPSGTYTENQPEELPAGLDRDFKEILSLIGNFHNTYGGLDEFIVELKK